jgi:hypothetical protein
MPAPSEEKASEPPSTPESVETTAEVPQETPTVEAATNEAGAKSADENSVEGGLSIEQSIQPMPPSGESIASAKPEESNAVTPPREEPAPDSLET